MDEHEATRSASAEQLKRSLEQWNFFFQRFTEAISPDHFPATNPDVMRKIAETQGQNLAEGFQQLQRDLAQNGSSFLNIPLTDTSSWQTGKNIACTPGSVVFQNDLVQLIYYHPTTKKAFRHPLLIIPPWINKYYILDLQPDNSMVRCLVDQGIPVFMISWVNADGRLREKTFHDYLKEGPCACLAAIAAMTGTHDVNLAGYCTGGTLLACLLATLKEHSPQTAVHSATFFTTLLDFSAAGDLALFIDEPQLALLENNMREKGYMDGRLLAALFSLLRAGDLIWPVWVRHYLKNEPLPTSPFLYWNGDSTNIPWQVHRYYLRNMYLSNALATPGQLRLGDSFVDLSQISVPCWFVATEKDHIAPWQACWQSSRLVSGPSQFVLAGAGHVAGIVNSPDRNRYGYRRSGRAFSSAEAFFTHATYKEGSWWPVWFSWLKKNAGKQVSVRAVQAEGQRRALESAPGSYVRVMLSDITSKE